MANFVVSGTPHVRSKESIQSIMRDVIIALIPATAAAIAIFVKSLVAHTDAT